METDPPAARPRRKRIWLCRVLMGLGVFIALGWVFWGAPVRRALIYDYIFLYREMGTGSARVWWDAHLYAMKLRGWQHEDGFSLGQYAGKEEVPWIISSGPSGADFDDCSSGHRGEALELITNQEAGPSREQWQQWWEKHQHETQAKWILQGFKDYGLTVALPLTRDMQMHLLKVAGQNKPPRNNPPTEDAVPPRIRFNAKRLLLETGFEFESVTPQDIGADQSGELLKGLLALKAAETLGPRLHSAFGEQASFESFNKTPTISHQWFPWAVLSFAALLFTLGWLGLKRARR